MGANEMPDGNSAAHRLYQRDQDRLIAAADAQEVDVYDDDLMKQLCGEHLAPIVQSMLVWRDYLDATPDADLRKEISGKLRLLLCSVRDAYEDAL